MDTQFAVLHIEKHGGSGKTALDRHIDRVHTPSNADPSLSQNNLRLTLAQAPDGKLRIVANSTANKPKETITERVNKRITEGYTSKKAIRKDAVRRLDIILTGSHERMLDIGKDTATLKEWMVENYRFLGKTYGRANIVSFVVHMDETTPHIHATIVPLTKDGRLCAKEIVGDKYQLEKLQDAYAEAMKPFGMERGLRNRHAHHTDTKEFYRQINANPVTLALNDITPEVPKIEANIWNYQSKIAEQNKTIAELRTEIGLILKEKNSNIYYTKMERERLKTRIKGEKRHIPPSKLAKPTVADRMMRYQDELAKKEREKASKQRSQGRGLGL